MVNKQNQINIKSLSAILGLILVVGTTFSSIAITYAKVGENVSKVSKLEEKQQLVEVYIAKQDVANEYIKEQNQRTQKQLDKILIELGKYNESTLPST